MATASAGAVDAEVEGPEQLLQLCKQELCRPPGSVKVVLRSGEVFETSFDLPTPIVLGGKAITIYPGEELYVEAQLGLEPNESLILRAVTENKHPEKTLTLKMWQEPGKAGTFLQVTNPMSKAIKYSALMMSTQSETLYKTSSCPVLDRKASYEHWPHEIFQLVLTDFRVVRSDASKCAF